MKVKNILTHCFIGLSFTAFAQGALENGIQDKFRSIEVKPKFGSYLYTGTELSDAGLLDAGYAAFSIKIGWQSSNTESWSSYFKYPTYGIGLYSASLGNAEVFGSPNAV